MRPMSTLSSTSTLAEIQAAYDDNGSYLEDASVAKARAFVTACQLLIRRTARRSRHGPAEVEVDVEQLRSDLREARAWLATNDTARHGPRATLVSLEHYR